MRTRHLPLLMLSALVLVTGVAVAGVLGHELASCYVPFLDVATLPVCGSGIWGFVAAPVVLLAACTAVLAAGGLGAARTATRQVRGAGRFRRRLLSAPTVRDDRVAGACRRVGVSAELISDDRPLALTVGMVRPRVLLTTGLVVLLDDRELEAVVVHEAWHAARRHPAVYALVRTAADAVVLLPVVNAWARRVVLRAEMDADAAAVRAVGRASFASALLKLADDRDPLRDREAAYGSVRGMVHDRIRVLAGQPPEPAFDRRQVWLSVAGAFLVVAPTTALLVALARSGR